MVWNYHHPRGYWESVNLSILNSSKCVNLCRMWPPNVSRLSYLNMAHLEDHIEDTLTHREYLNLDTLILSQRLVALGFELQNYFWRWNKATKYLTMFSLFRWPTYLNNVYHWVGHFKCLMTYGSNMDSY